MHDHRHDDAMPTGLQAPRWSRLSLSAVVGVALLSGCATTSGRPGAAPAARDGTLYSGQPEVVFATEFPVESADDALARATAAVNEGDLDRALYYYAQAANLAPEDPAAYNMIGAIYERKGNTALAGRAYARAIAVDPDNAVALQGLGVAYFDSREIELAQSTLQRAVDYDAKLWRAHNVLGVIADTHGEHVLATEHFTSALEIRGDEASILNNRGYSNYLAGNFDAAEKDFLDALAIDAAYDRARRNLGLLYARKGNYSAALRELSTVSSKHVAANDVGYVAMLNGSYAVAGNFFADAIRLSPRYYETAEKNLATLRELSRDAAGAEIHEPTETATATSVETPTATLVAADPVALLP